MKNLKETILRIVQEENWGELQNIIKLKGKKKGKNQSDFEESVCELSRIEQDTIWNIILNYAAKVLEDDEALKNVDITISFDPILYLATVQVETLFTETKQYEPSNHLVRLITIIGNLLHEFKDFLELPAINLSELWASKDLPGSDDIRLNVLISLIQLSLTPHAAKQTVKRVWMMRQGLSFLSNRTEEEQTSIALFLLKCGSSSTYINCDEGVKFLSVLLVIPNLTKSFHKAIKYELPFATKTQSANYAEVYFRAWKGSQDQLRKTIEEDCLQDLMYLAVHADQTKSKLPSNLNAFMHQLHKNKKHPQTATMLYKLYEHFIWRSFTVANGFVRANATALFCDAFPFTDVSVSNEERESLMDRQYEAILNLLLDPSHLVRLEAIKGVFNILFEFWLMVPSHIIQKIFKIFIGKLIIDASTTEIRVEVVKGITVLLDCADAGPFISEILPKIVDRFDDINAAVRLAFVELLLKVKATRFIKFWKLVPMEHLLLRLANDTKPIQLLITHLIQSSFLPTHLDEQEMVLRCISLVDMNRDGARRFYQHASKRLDLETTTKFILFVWKTLHRYVVTINTQFNSSSVDEDPVTERATRKSRKRKKTSNVSKKIENKENNAPLKGSFETVVKEAKHDETGSSEPSQMPLDNPNTVAGLLDSIIILWTINAPRLAQPQNLKYREALKGRTSKNFMSIFSFFKENEEIAKSLLYYASFLPQNSIPSLKGTCISRLRIIALQEVQHVSVSSFDTYINALCNWNRVDDVIELVLEGLEIAFQSATDNDKTKQKQKSNARKGGRVCFQERESSLKAPICLMFLQYILKHPLNKIDLLHNHRDLLLNVYKSMANIKEVLENRMALKEESLSEKCSDDFLLICWSDYLSIITLLEYKVPSVDSRDEENESQESISDQIEPFDSSCIHLELIEWVSRMLNINHENSKIFSNCYLHILNANCDLIAIGGCDSNHIYRCIDFQQNLLELASFDSRLFAISCRFAQEVHSFMECYGETTKDVDSGLIIFKSTLESLCRNRMKLKDFDEEKLESLVNSTVKTVSRFVLRDGQLLSTICDYLLGLIIKCLSLELQKNNMAVPDLQGLNDLDGEANVIMRAVYSKSKMTNVFVTSLESAFEQEMEAEEMLSSVLLLDLIVKQRKNISPHALKSTTRKAKQRIEETNLQDTEVDKTYFKFCATESVELIKRIQNSLNM